MITVLRRPRLAAQLVSTMGPGWVAFRIGYALQLRAGIVRRRLPCTTWDEQPLRGFLRDDVPAAPEAYLTYRQEQAPAFLFAPADRHDVAPLLRRWDRGTIGPQEQADELERGLLCYFGHKMASIGWPPAWHTNPFTGQGVPVDRHWSEIGDFGHGDIKAIWEASRFGFVYPLVRAYWRTGAAAYAERFWRFVESWRAANLPQQGPNWKCGQETSLRVMAWCFGLYGFLDAPATTAARVADLVQMVAVSGRRIEATLAYALSQRNNHGISEGMGLWTIGALFPELRDADRWRERGRQVLEDLGQSLIAPDGTFVQHSVNYHRLMLHDYLWSLRLGDLHGRPFSEALRARVGRAGELLYQLQDDATGRLPCYGQHDGALILPLSNAGAEDFRPVLQATSYVTTGFRRYGDGPWDEELFWLCGVDALRAPVAASARTDLRAEVGGYYTLRSLTGFAFVRCTTFRDRPGQADMLHVDVWWRGQNVALDAGTYSYDAPAPWDDALARSAYHNTVIVDDRSQMDQVGRFLWLPWLRGRVRAQDRGGEGHLAYWEGQHDGYQRLSQPVMHRRGVVRLGAEHWLVFDDLSSRGDHRYSLHWLLPDHPHTVDGGLAGEPGATNGAVTLRTVVDLYTIRAGTLDGRAEFSLVRAAADGPRGWRAPSYLQREPALSLAVTQRASCVRFWTLLGPPGGTVDVVDSGLRVVHPEWEARLTLGTEAALPLVTSVRLTGTARDELRIAG